MTNQAVRHVILWNLFGVYAALMGITIIGMVVRPDFFNHPTWGISYLGSPGSSAIPYHIGFIIMITCLFAIVHVLKGLPGPIQVMRKVFMTSAIFMFGILLTSYPQGPVPYWLHQAVCWLLLVIYIVALVWIFRHAHPTGIDYLWLVVFSIGVALLVLSNDATHVLGLYPLAEIVAIVATLFLFGRATLRLLPTE